MSLKLGYYTVSAHRLSFFRGGSCASIHLLVCLLTFPLRSKETNFVTCQGITVFSSSTQRFAESIHAATHDWAGCFKHSQNAQRKGNIRVNFRLNNSRSLAESIVALRLIESLTLDCKGRLLAGGHRLAAIKQLQTENPEAFQKEFPGVLNVKHIGESRH